LIRTVVIGSCMSNLTVQLAPGDLGFYQTHCIHHNRSDAFLRYFVDQTSEMIPREYLEKILQYKPESEREARQILDNQYPASAGYFTVEKRRESAADDFLTDLKTKEFDLILLDNFMDISARLMMDVTRRNPEESPLFMNLGFYTNQTELKNRFKFYGNHLTPSESAENWLRIYHWLRRLQPKAKIIFICYHSVSSLNNLDRFSRLTKFVPELAAKAVGTDLMIVPPLAVPDHLTKGIVDWPHFTPPVYKSLAGLVYLLFNSDLASTTNFYGSRR
jgi:hypothetical protein